MLTKNMVNCRGKEIKKQELKTGNKLALTVLKEWIVGLQNSVENLPLTD